MASFLLRDARDPEHDMFVINPGYVPDTEEANLYAKEFTETAHEEGRTTEELIPLADAMIDLATNPNN